MVTGRGLQWVGGVEAHGKPEFQVVDKGNIGMAVEVEAPIGDI
jgi:hypothetical protein